MKTLALYAGSFNPIHAGHIQVIEIAKTIFGDDAVNIVIADNPKKKYTVSQDDRIRWIYGITGIMPTHTNGFICDYCNKVMASNDFLDNIVLIRGVRSAIDLDVEMPMAGYNYNISHGEYPTIFIPSPAPLRDLSSSAVRVIAKKGWEPFFETLYKPYAPKSMTYNKWVDFARDIWEHYNKV